MATSGKGNRCVLRHTARVQRLLAEGRVEDARSTHNEAVRREMRRAGKGGRVNVTDLQAAKEQIDRAA